MELAGFATIIVFAANDIEGPDFNPMPTSCDHAHLSGAKALSPLIQCTPGCCDLPNVVESLSA